jgi:hypothetical protein
MALCIIQVASFLPNACCETACTSRSGNLLWGEPIEQFFLSGE